MKISKTSIPILGGETLKVRESYNKEKALVYIFWNVVNKMYDQY